jgi:arylsulfatase A-like enzyme
MAESEATSTPSLERRPLARWRSIFWYAVWLAVLLAMAKGASVKSKNIDAERYHSDLMVATHNDTLFALVTGVIGMGALLLLRRRPRLQTAFFRGWVAMCALFIVYGVVSVKVYAFLRTPLTYPLLYIAGDFRNMRSSLGSFVTPGLIAALLGAPAAFLFLGWLCNRFLRPPASRTGAALMLVPVCFIAWQAWFGAKEGDAWYYRSDRRLVENPHWVFLRSCAQQLTGNSSLGLAAHFPESYRDDFRTAGARGATSQPLSWKGVRPKNVVLIVMESVGTKYLGLYGGKYDTTPRLQAQAAHAQIFTQYHAHQGMSANSLCNIITSDYTPISWRHFTQEHPYFPAVSIAAALSQRGYHTAYMTSTDTHWALFRTFLDHRGFDSIEDYRDLKGSEKISSWTVADSALFEHAREWLAKQKSDPFFLMMWTGQGHHPYALQPGAPVIDFFHGPPPPDSGDLGRYLNVLRQTDGYVADLMDWLKKNGLADDTLVVLTGDHGEAFGEPHDTYGHGLQIYDEVVRVPLMFWNPRMFPLPSRMDTLGGHIDLAPTILDFVGVPLPAGWQGRSLYDPNRTGRTYFFAAGYDYLLGVRENNWKYVFNATAGQQTLFDLSSDPNELSDLSAANKDRCEMFRQRIAAWAADQEQRNTAMEKKERVRRRSVK